MDIKPTVEYSPSLDIDQMMKAADNEPPTSDNKIDIDQTETEETPETDTPPEGDEDGENVSADGEESTDDSGEAEDADSGEADEDAGEGESDDVDASETPAPGVRYAAAKVGDKAVKVPLDAEWQVKINGKFETVKTSDLINEFSSKSMNSRKAQELIRQTKQVEATQKKFDEIVTTFAEKAEKGDPIGAFQDLIGATGKNPYKVIQQFRKKLVEEAREYLLMDEATRARVEDEYEKKVLQYEIDRRDTVTKKQTEEQRLMAQVNSVCQQYNIPDLDTFTQYAELATSYIQQQVASGAAPEGTQVTAEVVGRYYKASQQKVMMDRVLTKVNPKLAKDAEVIRDVSEIILASNPTEEELEEVLRETYGSLKSEQTKATQPAKPKVNKPGPKSTTGTKKVQDIDPGLDIDKTPRVTGW